jgi:predicted HTH transcriptional regulator
MPETNHIVYKQDVFGNSFTRMIFRFENDIKGSVKILNLIKEDKHITIPEIARRIELSTRAVEKQIAKLKEQNKLKRIGPDKGGHWEVIDNG